jgi:hypothetical protein
LVSVSCKCGEAIFPLDGACPACHVPITLELKDSLESRLEASHSEYANAKRVVFSSRSWLLWVALVYFVWAALIFGATYFADNYVPTYPEEARARHLEILDRVWMGTLLLSCRAGAKRNPGTAFAVCLGVLLVARVGVYVAFPQLLIALLTSLFGYVLIGLFVATVFMLIRGIVAARRLRAILSSMRRGSFDHQLPVSTPFASLQRLDRIN